MKETLKEVLRPVTLFLDNFPLKVGKKFGGSASYNASSASKFKIR